MEDGPISWPLSTASASWYTATGCEVNPSVQLRNRAWKAEDSRGGAVRVLEETQYVVVQFLSQKIPASPLAPPISVPWVQQSNDLCVYVCVW
jgi:hypothetical protein